MKKIAEVSDYDFKNYVKKQVRHLAFTELKKI